MDPMTDGFYFSAFSLCSRGISQAEKEVLVGKAAVIVGQLMSADSSKGVEKFVWSLEVWWLLRCIDVMPPSKRCGDACFYLAVNVNMIMQFQVSDSGSLQQRDDPLEKDIFQQLLPLMELNAFNTPETVVACAETLKISSRAIASLTAVDERYGIAVLETMSSNLSSFATSFAASVCLEVTKRITMHDIAQKGSLLSHIQGVLVKTALASAISFSIHPSDIYERGESSTAVLNTSSFAAVAAAYHELGSRCGDTVLTGLLESAYSLHTRYPELSVATVHLLGTLLQDSSELEGGLADQACKAIEDALLGDDNLTRVSAALSLGAGCTSIAVAKKATQLMDAMITAMANEKGERGWTFASNLYVPEAHLSYARAIIDNCGDVGAFGYGAEGIVRACVVHGIDLSDTSTNVIEEIALELISWDVLASPVTRMMGLNLLTAKWKRCIDEALTDKRILRLHELWSSASSARKIGWALYESFICPAEEKYHMVREAAAMSLTMLIRAVGPAKVISSFEDLPEMLFVALDNGCMTVAPILLALGKADADRRFGFWIDLTRNIYNGGPKMQGIEINQRWESNVSRYGIKVVAGKLLDDAGQNLYADEWDAKAITRGVAVYIARIAVEVVVKVRLQKKKKYWYIFVSSQCRNFKMSCQCAQELFLLHFHH